MQKRSLMVRTTLLLLTLLQFGVPAAAAWADARLEQRSGPTHIESHSTDGCVRIHPADCAFHRFLSAPLARTSPVVVRIRAGLGMRWTARASRAAWVSSGVSLPDSRAPPTLS